jgi:hypothetical protein
MGRSRASSDCRGAAGFPGHSVTATLKLVQERGETFRERLVDSIVPGPEPLPDFPAAMGFGPGCRDPRTDPTYAARAGYY